MTVVETTDGDVFAGMIREDVDPVSVARSYATFADAIAFVVRIGFEAEAANLFFQLVSSRYERASMIVTSNKPFGRWGEVFGDVYMHDGVEIPAELGRFVDGFIGDSERSVQRDDALDQRPSVVANESAALGPTALRLFAPAVALGGAEAERGAHAELLAGVGQNVERALDELGRLVVIDQRAGARQQGLGDVEPGRGAQARLVEGAVEAFGS